MVNIIKSLFEISNSIFEDTFSLINKTFSYDDDVLPNLGKEILFNPENKKKYLEAINELETNGKTKPIELEDGSKVTITTLDYGA